MRQQTTMYHAALIAAQFLLAAGLVLSAKGWPIPVLACLLASPGVGLAVWAWFVMGLGRLRIRPSTTEQTHLICHGPYAIVRHPMYTGLLWFTAGLLLVPISWWRISMWIALLVVLVAKTREEERAMMERFPQYVAYQRRVGGLLPRLFPR